jgi:hypothetical protein
MHKPASAIAARRNIWKASPITKQGAKSAAAGRGRTDMAIRLKCLSHTPLRGLNDPSPEIIRDVDAALAKAVPKSKPMIPN